MNCTCWSILTSTIDTLDYASIYTLIIVRARASVPLRIIREDYCGLLSDVTLDEHDWSLSSVENLKSYSSRTIPSR